MLSWVMSQDYRHGQSQMSGVDAQDLQPRLETPQERQEASARPQQRSSAAMKEAARRSREARQKTLAAEAKS